MLRSLCAHDDDIDYANEMESLFCLSLFSILLAAYLRDSKDRCDISIKVTPDFSPLLEKFACSSNNDEQID
jgi:hypothetical protein